VNLTWYRKRRWFIGISLGWRGFVIAAIAPLCGVEIFYLKQQPWRGPFCFESGYRIFDEGMTQHLQGSTLRVKEQCVWQTDVMPPRGRIYAG
jgi:hypothetical protein